jgi:hypothetical protein
MSWLRNTTKAASSQSNSTPGVTTPSPPEDAHWLRKLTAACDKAPEPLPADEGTTTTLRGDIASLRMDIKARLAKLRPEDAD